MVEEGEEYAELKDMCFIFSFDGWAGMGSGRWDGVLEGKEKKRGNAGGSFEKKDVTSGQCRELRQREETPGAAMRCDAPAAPKQQLQRYRAGQADCAYT